MKARFFALFVAATLSTGVSAGDDVVGALARETGLSVRDVKMVLGARSGYAEYLASYDQTHKRFVKAIGKARYRDLMAGRAVPLLADGQRQALVQIAPPQR